MAKADHAKGFFNNIAASAAWESFKAWGWPPMTSLLAAIWLRVRHGFVDWWGIFALFCLTCLFVWFGRRKTSNVNPAEESQNRNDGSAKSGSSSEIVEIEKLKTALHDSARSNIGYRAERDRAREDIHALQGRPKIEFSEERERLDYIALRDKGFVCSQTFTPLQMEALTLSRDLGKFLDDSEPYPAAPASPSFEDAYDHYRGKGYDWGIRFRAKYDAQFSARIKEFVSHLEIERARVNSILRGGFEGVHTTEMVEKMRGELWREAMYAADVDFDKDYRHEA